MVKIDATASDFDKQDNRVLCCSLLQHMHHKKAVAARYQCNVWILGRHEAHLAVLSTGADTSVSVVADVDAVSFCWSWTSDSLSSPELLLSAAPHMLSLYDEMLWLTACMNCRHVYACGVVPLQTHLYALVIDDIGLLLCPPYCHSTTGASNVCLTVYDCTLKVHKKCEDVRVCKLDSRPERRMKALKNIICMRRVVADGRSLWTNCRFHNTLTFHVT